MDSESNGRETERRTTNKDGDSVCVMNRETEERERMGEEERVRERESRNERLRSRGNKRQKKGTK